MLLTTTPGSCLATIARISPAAQYLAHDVLEYDAKQTVPDAVYAHRHAVRDTDQPEVGVLFPSTPAVDTNTTQINFSLHICCGHSSVLLVALRTLHTSGFVVDATLSHGRLYNNYVPIAHPKH